MKVSLLPYKVSLHYFIASLNIIFSNLAFFVRTCIAINWICKWPILYARIQYRNIEKLLYKSHYSFIDNLLSLEIFFTNMRCISVSEFGGPEVLKLITGAAIPKPQARQVCY